MRFALYSKHLYTSTDHTLNSPVHSWVHFSCSYTLCTGGHFKPAPSRTTVLLDDNFNE